MHTEGLVAMNAQWGQCTGLDQLIFQLLQKMISQLLDHLIHLHFVYEHEVYLEASTFFLKYGNMKK